MAEVDLKIGGRTYKVACQDGEEDHLIAAAGTLNAEAETVLEASGARLSEARLLLMAGLMLADQSSKPATGGVSAKTALAQNEALAAQITTLEADLAEAQEAQISLAAALAEAQSLVAGEPAEAGDPTVLARLASELEAVAAVLEGGTEDQRATG